MIGRSIGDGTIPYLTLYLTRYLGISNGIPIFTGILMLISSVILIIVTFVGLNYNKRKKKEEK